MAIMYQLHPVAQRFKWISRRNGTVCWTGCFSELWLSHPISIPQRRKCPVWVIVFSNLIVELGTWIYHRLTPFIIIISIFIKYLLIARCHAKCFSCIAPFNPFSVQFFSVFPMRKLRLSKIRYNLLTVAELLNWGTRVTDFYPLPPHSRSYASHLQITCLPAI